MRILSICMQISNYEQENLSQLMFNKNVTNKHIIFNLQSALPTLIFNKAVRQLFHFTAREMRVRHPGKNFDLWIPKIRHLDLHVDTQVMVLSKDARYPEVPLTEYQPKIRRQHSSLKYSEISFYSNMNTLRDLYHISVHVSVYSIDQRAAKILIISMDN